MGRDIIQGELVACVSRPSMYEKSFTLSWTPFWLCALFLLIQVCYSLRLLYFISFCSDISLLWYKSYLMLYSNTQVCYFLYTLVAEYLFKFVFLLWYSSMFSLYICCWVSIQHNCNLRCAYLNSVMLMATLFSIYSSWLTELCICILTQNY